MSKSHATRDNWLKRRNRELGWFGWLAYGLFAVSVLGLLAWLISYASTGGWEKAITETLPYWLSGIGGPAALVAIYETSKRTRQVERSVTDIASSSDGEGQKSGARVAWKVEESGKSQRRIMNAGAATAQGVNVKDVTNPDGRSGFDLLDDGLPHDVAINDFIAASMDRSLADPFLSRIRISWTEKGESYDATYSVS